MQSESCRKKDDCRTDVHMEVEEKYRPVSNTNEVKWYGHVQRWDGNSVLRVALNLEVSGKKKR